MESLGGFGSRMDPGEYSRVQMGGGMLGLAAVGTASMLQNAGLISEDAAGATAAGTLMTGALNQPLLVRQEVRNRPIFEFRSLGMVERSDLVAAGMALWDYVDIAHGRSQSYVSLSTAARVWNLAASFF